MDQTGESVKSGWWLAYFGLVSLAFIGSLILGPHSPIRLLSYVFDGFSLVGLWGYISGKAIGWRQFWAIYLVLSVAEFSMALVPSLWDGLQHDFAWVVLGLIAALIQFPCWLAIWRYAFRSPHVWQRIVAA